MWNCAACTFENTKELGLACEMCGTERSFAADSPVAKKARTESHKREEASTEEASLPSKHVVDPVAWFSNVIEPAAEDESAAKPEEEPAVVIEADCVTGKNAGFLPEPLDEAEATPALIDGAALGNSLLRELAMARLARGNSNSAAESTPAAQVNSGFLPEPVTEQEEAFLARSSSSLSSTSSSSCQRQRPALTELRMLTYNVWFKWEVQGTQRMDAIGDLVTEHSPHFIALQECIPGYVKYFETKRWYQDYHSSYERHRDDAIPYFTVLLWRKGIEEHGKRASAVSFDFRKSIMGRDLKMVKLQLHGGLTVVVSTSHLESPLGGKAKSYTHERQGQMREVLERLGEDDGGAGADLVLFGGDMNWSDKRDGNPLASTGTAGGGGQPNLKQMFTAGGKKDGQNGGSAAGGSGGSARVGSWTDAWLAVHGKTDAGYTYDGKENQMLANNFRDRLDRILVRSAKSGGGESGRDSSGSSSGETLFTVADARLIGTEPLPVGLITYSYAPTRVYTEHFHFTGAHVSEGSMEGRHEDAACIAIRPLRAALHSATGGAHFDIGIRVGGCACRCRSHRSWQWTS
jgi:hypothetical protein